MTWYTFLLFVHVSMAIIWIGGGLMMQLFGVRAAMSGDPSRMAAVGEDIEWIANRAVHPGVASGFPQRRAARGRVGLLRLRRRLDRHRARPLCDDLPRRASVPRAGVGPDREAQGGRVAASRPEDAAPDHAVAARPRAAIPHRLRHDSQAGLRRRGLVRLGGRSRGDRRRGHLLALPRCARAGRPAAGYRPPSSRARRSGRRRRHGRRRTRARP